MPKTIIDTDALSWYCASAIRLPGNTATNADSELLTKMRTFVLDEVVNGEHEAVLTAVTVGEILSAELTAGEFDRLHNFLVRNYIILPFDVSSAAIAAQVWDAWCKTNSHHKKARRRRDNEIILEDIKIVAIGSARQVDNIVTGNVRDFNRWRGLLPANAHKPAIIDVNSLPLAGNSTLTLFGA